MKLLLPILFILLISSSFGQETNDEIIISKFKSIAENPEFVGFDNSVEVNNIGGHLQGIQLIHRNETNYAILSGSSDSYAYLPVVKLGDKSEVISVNQLMDKPFKHAGGFQIFENYLAVGIEDNEKKDKSKVCIYDISNPENISVQPVEVIEREGKPLRSTAGCVGVTSFNDQILLAVGDWDTKNIDFYSCSENEIGKSGFELMQSVNSEKLAKNEWSDPHWHAYQNINLFTFNKNLYLIGFGQNSNQNDVADLFRLKYNDSDEFEFVKLASKSFNCEKESSFKAGAGLVYYETGDMQIISCGYNLEDANYLNYFENKIFPAHAHNDYEHPRPLLDALECNFKSIEADVFSIGDSLYVAHDFDKIKPGRTLRQLYLEPLKNQIINNNGSVYGNGEELILFIDIKDDGLKTYQNLHRILTEYKSHLTTFTHEKKKQGNIMVVVSGNRPFEFMQSQTIRYAGFDGRMENLDSGISPALMPVISDNWAKHFAWNGTGEMPDSEKMKLQNLAAEAKSRGYILRFWNTPNRTTAQRQAVWTELHTAGVGLTGADNLKELQQFFLSEK
jgi:hypothetical protein